MSMSRALWMSVLIASIPATNVVAQTDFTNDITGDVVEFWDVISNWDPNGVPGFQVSTGLGNSNDTVVVNFLTAGAATDIPQLDLFGESYVIESLTFTEDTVANHNADGNLINTGGFGGFPVATVVVQRVEYITGGREVDIKPQVIIEDWVDGKAFEIIQAGAALDFGGGIIGTEGLFIMDDENLFIRGMEQLGFGSHPTNGLTVTGVSGESKYFLFNAPSNYTYNIPNLTIGHDGNQNLIFGVAGFDPLAKTNLITVNIDNVFLNTNTTRINIGGDSQGSGEGGVEVNVNGMVDFSVAQTSANRQISLRSMYGGIVNFNSNIVFNQDLDVGRTNIFEGDGVARLRADIIQTNGTAYSNNIRIDGTRSLVVEVDQQSRLGTGEVDLRNGTVLRPAYDVFANGYPGSSIRYGENANIFFDFAAPQTGFYDPISNNTTIGMVVRAFNGISGDLTGANFTNASGAYANNTISFQTNAIIGERATALPTRDQMGGAILYQGIQDAGGTYTNIGDDGSTSIYKGVAISALTPNGADIDIGILDPNQSNDNDDDFGSGFHGTLTARAGQDLEVLVPGEIYVRANNFDTNAQFNADTGVANFRGPGNMLFQRRDLTVAWGGTVTNLVRIGLDGVAGPENPLAINSQNSIIADLVGDEAVPLLKTLTIKNGQVRFRDAQNLGSADGLTNTILRIGAGGNLRPDDNAAAANTINVTRGKIIFEDDGALYLVTSDLFGAATSNAGTNVLNAMEFGPNSLLILNDVAQGRDLANAMGTHVLSNMNILFSDNDMRTVQVQNASAFAMGEGKTLMHARNSNGEFNMLYSISGGVTNDVPINAAAGVTQVFFVASRDGGAYRTLGIDPSVNLPTTDLIIGKTNDFITVNDNSSTRSMAGGSGSVRIDGTSNVFQNIRVASGAILFHETGATGTNDHTLITGDLIIDAVNPGNSNITFHRVSNGDFQVLGNLVINESGLLPHTTNVAMFRVEAPNVTNLFWGNGENIHDRLLNGTLVQGADGIVVKDYGRLEISMTRTALTYTVGQKVTIDNTGPNYPVDARNLDLRADGAALGGNPTFMATNIWMRDGSFLRINENNSTAQIGLVLEGTAFLSEGTTTADEDFDLINVDSSVPGMARVLQIGTTNSVDDTAFTTELLGVASPDITFDIVNGQLTSRRDLAGDIQGGVNVRANQAFLITAGPDAIMNLSGGGRVLGDVNVSNLVAPGDGVGTLTITGDVRFFDTTAFNFELRGDDMTVGGGINDLLSINGAGSDVTLDGVINVGGLTPFTNVMVGDTWTIIRYGGVLTSNGLELGVFPEVTPGLTWAIDYDLVNKFVNLTIVVPEPTTWILVGLGLGLIGFAARRRR